MISASEMEKGLTLDIVVLALRMPCCAILWLAGVFPIVSKSVEFSDPTFMGLPAGLHSKQQFDG